ncbi:MAG: hypothetical protein ABWZ67_12405 [Solirubrobacteraceae bacterium]
MAYDTTEARREMLAEIAGAADDLAAAIAALGEAYELLDEANADRLEDELFGPIQAAYGRAKRTHAGFAARMGLASGSFAPATAGHPSQGVTGFLEAAFEDVSRADARLSELQDSMRPVDVGDAELRAGLAEVRTLLAELPARARNFMRTLGR